MPVVQRTMSVVAIGPDGFFTGVGGARPLGYIWQSVITRYSPEGKPDNALAGDQGLIISNVATGERNSYGVALQAGWQGSDRGLYE